MYRRYQNRATGTGVVDAMGCILNAPRRRYKVNSRGAGRANSARRGVDHNGWALYGFAQSLELQSRNTEASTAQQQFDIAWKNADVTLVASAY